MRTIRRSSSPLDELSEAFKQFAKRRAVEIWGLALIGAAGAFAVALATWSVNDPSLNHATQAPVRNRLGAPGAVVADLLRRGQIKLEELELEVLSVAHGPAPSSERNS